MIFFTSEILIFFQNYVLSLDKMCHLLVLSSYFEDSERVELLECYIFAKMAVCTVLGLFCLFQVWCDTGYPRLVRRPGDIALTGQISQRCACFQEDELNKPGLVTYEGCDHLSKSCKVN
jgi:hypothetical protein